MTCVDLILQRTGRAPMPWGPAQQPTHGARACPDWHATGVRRLRSPFVGFGSAPASRAATTAALQFLGDVASPC